MWFVEIKSSPPYSISRLLFLLGRLLSHLLQVGVAPYLPIRKHPGNQATLAIVLQPLGSRTSLQGTDLPAACAAHVNWQQLAAGHPQDRVACSVIYDLQQELPVVIINLLCPQGAVIINGENVSSVHLWVTFHNRWELKINTFLTTLTRCCKSSVKTKFYNRWA